MQEPGRVEQGEEWIVFFAPTGDRHLLTLSTKCIPMDMATQERYLPGLGLGQRNILLVLFVLRGSRLMLFVSIVLGYMQLFVFVLLGAVNNG